MSTSIKFDLISTGQVEYSTAWKLYFDPNVAVYMCRIKCIDYVKYFIIHIISHIVLLIFAPFGGLLT